MRVRCPRLWSALAGCVVLLYVGGSMALFRASQALAGGRQALDAGERDLAQARVDKGLRWNPRSPDLYELRSAIRLSGQDWAGARADLDRAIQLAPAGAGFRLASAELAREEGDIDRALEEYAMAVRLLPLKAVGWERWGDLLADQNRRTEARDAYDGALRALSDPRTLGGSATARHTAGERVIEKRRRVDNG